MPLIRTKILTVEEVFAALEKIHDDVQTKFHDQWDWMNASFYVEALKTHYTTAEGRVKELERYKQLTEPVVVEHLIRALKAEAENSQLREKVAQLEADANHVACAMGSTLDWNTISRLQRKVEASRAAASATATTPSLG